MGSVCVTGAGLNTAIFCDIVAQLLSRSARRATRNQVAAGRTGGGRSAAARSADGEARGRARVVRAHRQEAHRHVARRGRDSQRRHLQRRGGRDPERPRHLSGEIARPLGVKDLYQAAREAARDRRCRRAAQDAPRCARSSPSGRRPIFYCGKEVGDALPFPGAASTKDFAWAPAHPVVDAYRAFKPMPYDAPSYDLAAAHFAVHPDSGFFQCPMPALV